MRLLATSLGLVLALLGALFLLVREPEPDRVDRGVDRGGKRATGASSEATRPRASAGGVAPRAAAASDRSAPPLRDPQRRAQREATLAKIEAALRARQEAAEAEDTRRRAAGAPSEVEGPPAQVGDLKDRSGTRDYLREVMNEELMPLIDECYALAREGDPELAGHLALDVELLGDEEVGGVVATVDLSESNEVVDPTLIECARESLFATTLPPPPESGRDAFMLSLRLEPERH